MEEDGRINFAGEIWKPSAGRIPTYWERSGFCSIQSWKWLDKSSTHILKNNLLYYKSTDLNVNLIQKHPYRNIQNNVWPDIWAPWLSQIDTKLNHKICSPDRLKLGPFFSLVSLSVHCHHCSISIARGC